VVAIPRIAHVLDLDGGFDHVWTKRFNGKTRNKIRKAEKAGLTIERDRSGELLPVFYDLFLQSVSRWAAKQHEPLWMARWRARRRDPITKFESISKALGDSLRLWIARYHGQPAAAVLVLQGANAHYTRGAMNKDLAGPTLANYLLHRVAIEEACEAGCRYYHMGETGSSGSLAQFKTQFGAEAFAYAEYRLERVPISKLDQGLRRIVKRIIGFQDA
jgi:lipid II:glycine glycyltransferase (peptidoglycan interpeptide bridge formation enzyme)